MAQNKVLPNLFGTPCRIGEGGSGVGARPNQFMCPHCRPDNRGVRTDIPLDQSAGAGPSGVMRMRCIRGQDGALPSRLGLK